MSNKSHEGGVRSWFVPPVVVPAAMVVIVLVAAWLNWHG